MKRKVKFILFMLAFCFIFLFVNRLYGPEWYFYQEEKDSMNVLYFGSSFSYCSFNPQIIDDANIHSYNLASQQQPIQLTYYVIKEALKYQNPKVIVLEPWMMTADYQIPSANLMASSLDKLNLNFTKLEAIASSANKNDMIEMIFPVLRLHSDQKNLTTTDFMNYKDTNRGYVSFSETKSTDRPSQDILDNENKADIPGNNAVYLEKIIDLTKQENIQLLIVKAPLPITEGTQETLNSVKEIAKNNDIPYIDYSDLYEDINFDFTMDTIDGQHLNNLGSEKVSKHFKTILEEYIK